MDYDYPNDKESLAQSKFNITFDVTVNSQLFVVNFSNQRLSNQNQYIADTFIGSGESYTRFLLEVESNAELQNKKQYSDQTKNAANEVIGAIAESVYIHVQSHSPDQDEE